MEERIDELTLLLLYLTSLEEENYVIDEKQYLQLLNDYFKGTWQYKTLSRTKK